MLDIDNESLCDIYVDYYLKEDKNQESEMYYKIYLKCKDCEDDGYINWRKK